MSRLVLRRAGYGCILTAMFVLGCSDADAPSEEPRATAEPSSVSGSDTGDTVSVHPAAHPAADTAPDGRPATDPISLPSDTGSPQPDTAGPPSDTTTPPPDTAGPPSDTATPATDATGPYRYVFLCLGQSNMSGQAPITPEDRVVDPRLEVLASAAHSGRTVGEFYPAVPPIGHSGTQMGPCDFFGRRMIEVLPPHITVALVNVAIGGQSIRLFHPDTKAAYIAAARAANEWWIPYLDEYGGDVYDRLVQMGRIAKQQGEIKGILLHQGESDWEGENQALWPTRVKEVYESLLADIGLSAENVPLLVGELLRTEQGGAAGGLNSTMIARIPGVIPTAHIISSEGCTMMPGDEWSVHFSRQGYELLGRRYADTMVELLGY